MKSKVYKHKKSLLTALFCLGSLCAGSTAWGQADLWIKDNAADTGNEPNMTTTTFWASPDIWISHPPSMIPQYNPLGGALNWVHITVRNRGTAPSTGTEEVYLYWAKASTGLSWNTQWLNYYTSAWTGCTATLFGDLAGYATIPALAAGGSTDVIIPWNAPNPADYSCFGGDQTHFCLLARIVPGMSFPETSNAITNTQNNNNIAWRNVYLTKVPPGTGNPVKSTVFVRNVKDVQTTMNLRVSVPQNDDGTDGSIFDHATVRMVLAQGLYQKWQANGAQGENIEDQGEGAILLTDANAWVGGIPMAPGETYDAGLDFTRTDDDFTGIMHIDMIQDDNNEGTGGERFTVDFSADDGADGLVTEVPDKAIPANELSVYPNPAQTEFTISSVDKSASYSARVLDALGREVYKTNFSGDLKINVAKFSKGTYFIEMKNVQTGTQTVKQVVVE
jgi:serine protease